MVKLSTAYGAEPVDMFVTDFSDFEEARGRGNDHVLRMKLSGEVTVVRGNFDYNKAGDLTGGTATSVAFGFGPYEGTTWAGININLRLWDRVSNSDTLSDDAALFAKIFQDNDAITGNADNDILNGGAGDDIIVGSYGGDDLTGGAGADVFKYFDLFESHDSQGVDEITDFSQAEGDRISLRDVGDLEFAGNSTDVEDGQVVYFFSSGKTIIHADSGRGYTMEIKIHGEVSMTAADFIL